MGFVMRAPSLLRKNVKKSPRPRRGASSASTAGTARVVPAPLPRAPNSGRPSWFSWTKIPQRGTLFPHYETPLRSPFVPCLFPPLFRSRAALHPGRLRAADARREREKGGGRASSPARQPPFGVRDRGG